MLKEKHKWIISITSLIVVIIMIFTFTIKENKYKSKNTEVTKLDAVLDKNSVTDIKIDIDESDWKWLLENATKEEYKSCNITINGETYNNVGIRPKGNTSLTSVANDDTTDRYSFKIDFNQYVEGQTYNGIESIVLNNMIQDNTYMKEYLTYDLYDFLGVAVPEMSYSDISINGEEWGLYLAIEVIDERYLENNFGTMEGNLYKPETMGVNNNGGDNRGGGNPPEWNNGKPQGGPPDMNGQKSQDENEGNNLPQDRYPDMQEINADEGQKQNENNQSQNQENPERMNNDNKQNKMGGRASEGADFVYKDDEVSSYSIVRDSAVFKRTTDEDFKKVINMYKNLNSGTNLEEVLDVKEVLKYFAVNTYVVNLDSYSGQMYHNYYLYENNGVCSILPWDLNLSFGGFGVRGEHNNDSKSSANTTINFPIDNPVSGNLEDMPLLGKILENDEYKELYHSYLQKIADEYFNNGHYEELVNKIDHMISPYVEKDNTKFCTYEEYKSSVPQMITFGKDRTKSVLAQLKGEQPSTEYGTVESDIDMSALGNMGGGRKPGNDKMQRPQNEQNGEVKDNGEITKNEHRDHMQNINVQKVNDTDKKKEEVIAVGLIVVVALSIVFVSKYKRRRY